MHQAVRVKVSESSGLPQSERNHPVTWQGAACLQIGPRVLGA